MDFLTAAWLLVASQTVQVTTTVHEKVTISANQPKPIFAYQGERTSSQVTGTAQVYQGSDYLPTSEIEKIICAPYPNGFADRCDAAITIATCESGLDPNKVNKGDSHITGRVSTGLFMHNEDYFQGWNDPIVSTRKAVEKYNTVWNGQIRGWTPWLNCARKAGLL